MGIDNEADALSSHQVNTALDNVNLEEARGEFSGMNETF